MSSTPWRLAVPFTVTLPYLPDADTSAIWMCRLSVLSSVKAPLTTRRLSGPSTRSPVVVRAPVVRTLPASSRNVPALVASAASCGRLALTPSSSTVAPVPIPVRLGPPDRLTVDPAPARHVPPVNVVPVRCTTSCDAIWNVPVATATVPVLSRSTLEPILNVPVPLFLLRVPLLTNTGSAPAPVTSIESWSPTFHTPSLTTDPPVDASNHVLAKQQPAWAACVTVPDTAFVNTPPTVLEFDVGNDT